MLRPYKKAVAVGVLGLGMVTAGSVLAQQNEPAPPATGTPATTTRTDRAADRDNRGFDMGWLGLIGLAGLAGLMRGDRVDHRHMTTPSVTR